MRWEMVCEWWGVALVCLPKGTRGGLLWFDCFSVKLSRKPPRSNPAEHFVSDWQRQATLFLIGMDERMKIV